MLDQETKAGHVMVDIERLYLESSNLAGHAGTNTDRPVMLHANGLKRFQAGVYRYTDIEHILHRLRVIPMTVRNYGSSISQVKP
jgi:hypothetical protein